MDYYVERTSETYKMYDARVQLTRKNDRKFTDPHLHVFIEILYGIEGNYTVTVNGKTRLFSKDDLILISSNQVHQIYPVDDPEGKYLVLKINPEMIYAGKNFDGEIDFARPFLSDDNFNYNEPDDELRQVFKRIVEIVDEKQYGYEIALKGQIFSVIYWFLSRVKKDFEHHSYDKRIEILLPALKFIENNYSEKISVKDLAKLCFMEYTAFSKLFKKVMRVDCIRYINNFRIQKSEQLLILNKMSITEIGLEVGFENPCYYIKVFKEEKGVTPTAYRKLYNL